MSARRPGTDAIASAYPTIFARAAAVHCVSEAVREEAVRFGLDRAKARVIHPAVDMDFFSPAPREPREPEELRVIGVGRLNWVRRAMTTRSKRWRRWSAPECR